ncbi:MAG TPA: alpha/beta hydrolase [Ktedonobacteraceae bacterium]|nr:alpha/beta hydrolase [Ktedonobacteraceae bacterium]
MADLLSVEPKSAFVDAENGCLHYLAWDAGASASEEDEIPLVLLHGLAATADTWRLVADSLEQQHQLVAFDLPGHGLSDPANDYALATVTEDVVSGMAALGLGQVALVGHGYGARVALALTARHPALVSHLVLVDMPLIEPRHWPGMTRERFIRQSMPRECFASRAAFLQAMQQEMADFWSPEVEAIVLASIRVLADGTVEERLRAEDQRRIRETLWEDRALSYYGKVACPVLLVPAAASPQEGEAPPEQLERAEDFSLAKGYMAVQVARAIRHCTIHWVPETTHDIQLQRPQRLAAAIASFVRE